MGSKLALNFILLFGAYPARAAGMGLGLGPKPAGPYPIAAFSLARIWASVKCCRVMALPGHSAAQAPQP